MANVLRTQFFNQDGRLNLDKGILTFYSENEPYRIDVRKTENSIVVMEFLNKALADGKTPSKNLYHETNKNRFLWSKGKLKRFNVTKNTTENLLPDSEFTKKILLNMVRAYVK